MLTNTWRGPCRYCKKPVGKRKGHAEKSATTGHWLVWHKRCEPPAAEPEPRKVRSPYADD